MLVSLSGLFVLLSLSTSRVFGDEDTTEDTVQDSIPTWSVDNCIRMQMKAQITIIPDKNLKNETVTMEIPPEANATGSCNHETKNDATQQFINLTWYEPDPEDSGLKLLRSVELYFGKNKTTTPVMYGVNRINARYDLKHYIKVENSTDPATNKTILTNVTYLEYVQMTTYTMTPLEFLTPLNNSYTCLDIGRISSLQAEKLDTRFPAQLEKLDNANMTATSVHFDAFRPDDLDPGTMQAALDCSFRSSDVVPIIVGCALAGTVLLVLVAYLIGRRRSRARGYQSV